MPPKGGAKSDKELKDEAAKKERYEQEVQLRMMVASTLANDELELKKQTLDQYQQLSQRLKDENAKLRDEMLERDRDSLQVVEFLRREVEKKQEQIEDLKNKIEDQSEKAADRLKEREQELQEVIKCRDEDLAKKADEIQGLEATLESVQKFKSVKHEMEHEIKQLEEALKDTKDRYEKDLSKLRFHSLEEKVRLKAEEKALNERFEEKVRDRAMADLPPQIAKIYQNNKKLETNNSRLEQEIAQLSSRSKDLEEEKRRKQREIELSQQSVEEYSKQGYRAHKEIRELAQRNRQLEGNLARVVNQYEADRQGLVQRSGVEQDELQQQLRECQQALEVRSLELHRIRRLARVIIQQRSDLEIFFTEALEYVRQQAARERGPGAGLARSLPGGSAAGTASRRPRISAGSSASQRQRAASGRTPRQPQAPAQPPPPPAGGGELAGPGADAGDGGADLAAFAAGDFRPIIQMEEQGGGQLGTPPESLPPINGTPRGDELRGGSAGLHGGAADPPPSAGGEARVDISDLSWADKERVLRILFAKINSQQTTKRQQQRAKPPPPAMIAAPEDPGNTFLTQQHDGAGGAVPA